jgi:RNA polymerase sigma-70 factor (ECF subfamily)
MEPQSSPSKESPRGLDQIALQALLHENAARLLAYVSRHLPEQLRSSLEPEDVLQDVFLEVFLRIGEFQAQGSDAAYRWIVTIARHRMVNLLQMAQAAKRGKRRNQVPGLDSVIDLLEQLAVYTRTPSQSALSHEVVKVVQNSLSAVAPRFREAIQYRYLDGLSIRKTAEHMQTTEGVITTLCYRGLRELKMKLLAYVSTT